MLSRSYSACRHFGTIFKAEINYKVNISPSCLTKISCGKDTCKSLCCNEQLLRLTAPSIHDKKDWDQFQIIDFKPKQPGDYDIDIKIQYCGVCGSDVRILLACPPSPLLNSCAYTRSIRLRAAGVTLFLYVDLLGYHSSCRPHQL